MRHIRSLFFLVFGLIITQISEAQTSAPDLVVLKKVNYSPIKNQGNSGTCWSFSATSLVESQTLSGGYGDVDLSEMFTVRNTYIEKARNYMLRQGSAQFGPGGLGHDVIHAIATYGAVPESVYSGLTLGERNHNHFKLDSELKSYLDSLLKTRPIPSDWMKGFQSIMDDYLGKAPEVFTYKEKQYTPITFAKEVLHFSADDYVNVTSYTHHPFYAPFILEAPDNFLNGSFYNLPLEEMIKVTERALELGYSLMWDADVSNSYFDQKNGYAIQRKAMEKPKVINPDEEEVRYDQAMRQALYENLTSQDDHLMHLVGLEKSKGGKTFFLVKNSWGEVGPFKGLINVSETYFAINTVSLVIPKAAFDNALKLKLGLK
jgi:bleomycin hydrolase